MPRNIEGGQLRIELKITIRQMVMDPPGQRLPVASFLKMVNERSDYHTGGRTHVPIGISPVPYMPRVVGFVARAAVSLFVAEVVYLAGPISGSDSEASEFILQWFKQFLAKLCARLDGKVGVIRNVW